MLSPDGKIGFMRYLKELDKDLDCYFNDDMERFVVTMKGKSGRVYTLFKVETEDGSFRYPDLRDIGFLRSGDQKVLSFDEQQAIRDCRNKRDDEIRTAKRKSMFRDLTKDGSYWLRKAIRKIDGVADCSPFRRVQPTARGKVF